MIEWLSWLVIGLVINSRSIFHRSICWPIRFSGGGWRIFWALLVRGKSNFKIRWQVLISLVERGGEEKFESLQKGDVGGMMERGRFNTLKLGGYAYGRRAKRISAPCSIICPAFISSFRDRDCFLLRHAFRTPCQFYFARIYDPFPGSWYPKDSHIVVKYLLQVKMSLYIFPLDISDTYYF